MGGAISLACANAGAHVAWVVPTYKNGRPLWRWAETTVKPLRKAGVQVNRSERIIEFPSGGFVSIYSADNPTSILGEAFHLIIADEAARMEESVWTETLMPTLADHDGRAMLISTPRGRNWFWQEWQKGQSANSEVKSWNAPSSANPNPRIQNAARLARDRVARSVYEQEWQALFVEDGLTLFTIADIDRASQPYAAPTAGAWLTTVDVGRRRDATVINTFDISQSPYRRVAFDRLERVPYPLIQQRIAETARRWPGRLVIESNGVGDPLIENLDVHAQSFVTTAKSKLQALQALQLLFEQGVIRAQWDARERAALVGCSWDEEHTPDEVMSLAIFAANAGRPAGGFVHRYDARYSPGERR
jgi:hypothetical protein